MSAFALPSAAFSPAQIARRVALPLLMFASVLTALLLLSWYLVLPRYTSFAVDGKMLAASALPDYEKDILADIDRAVARREELALPTRDAQYLSLIEGRSAEVSLLREYRALAGIAAALDLRANVVIASVRVDDAGAVRVTGDVRGLGFGSMAALARFVDAVAADAGVADLRAPAFIREDDPETGPHSPFDFTYSRAAR